MVGMVYDPSFLCRKIHERGFYVREGKERGFDRRDTGTTRHAEYFEGRAVDGGVCALRRVGVLCGEDSGFEAYVVDCFGDGFGGEDCGVMFRETFFRHEVY